VKEGRAKEGKELLQRGLRNADSYKERVSTRRHKCNEVLDVMPFIDSKQVRIIKKGSKKKGES